MNMDVKVYNKEEVLQPEGSEYVYVPDVIDIIPEYSESNEQQLISCEIVTGKEEVEQSCALATIFQRGLDPLDMEDGIRWSEAILGETSVIQLMDDITNAVEKTSTAVTVVFDTVTDKNGNSYLTYSLKELT